MRQPEKLCTTVQAAIAILCLLVPQVTFAYNHPLSDTDVREAYFLGQDSERAPDFLAKYLQAPPTPDTGPLVAQIELSTPYAQVVKISQQNSVGYSAQKAAEDYKRRGDYIEVRVQVMFTPTYTGRGPDFWRAASIGLVQKKKHMAARSVTGQTLYAFDRDGDVNWIIGANVFATFSIAGVDDDIVVVEVIPPEGATVHVKFDLSSLL